MKYATFNVNSLKMRLDTVVSWGPKNAIDVLMLQELKTLDVPEMELNAAGYQVFAVPQKTYNGVATLVKQGISARLVRTQLPGMDDDPQARFVEIEITTPDGMCVTIINIYAPNGNPIGTEKFAYKLKWLNCLFNYLRDLRVAGKNILIAGDFNIIPEEIDAAHPENWTGDALFQTESRALYRSILYLGFVDSLRALHANDHDLYSFWDYQAGAWQRNNGIRIDHILLSPALADRLEAANVDRTPRAGEKPSDHTPVWAQLRG